jgi:hypothetical protein
MKKLNSAHDDMKGVTYHFTNFQVIHDSKFSKNVYSLLPAHSPRRRPRRNSY